MKRIVLIVILMLLFPISSSFAADIVATTGFNYDWFQSNTDDRGQQFYVPVAIRSSLDNLTVAVVTAYVYTYRNPQDGESQSMNDLIDTKLNLSYQILDRLPFDILLGLDFNLPTGRTKLKRDDLALIMDPDLVSINNFGEGFNVNPTITLAKGWDEWAAGIGIGYLWRGEYDYSQDVEEFDPGDILSLTGEVDYDLAVNWLGKAFVEYAHFTEDQIEGDDYAQEGDFYLLGLSLQHTQEKWDAAATIRTIFRQKSEFQDYSGGLKTEDNNSRGDEWIGDLNWRYFLDDATTLKTNLELLLVEKNEEPADSPFYVGQKRKVELGLGGQHTFNDGLAGEVFVKGFLVDIDRNWYHPDENRTYTGFTIGGMLSATF